MSGSHLILLVEDDGLRRDLPPALPARRPPDPGPQQPQVVRDLRRGTARYVESLSAYARQFLEQIPADPLLSIAIAGEREHNLENVDADIRDSLGVLLECEGFTVVPAEHGADALAQLRAGLRPCLIILDLMMPVMDGLEFRRRQQGHSSH